MNKNNFKRINLRYQNDIIAYKELIKKQKSLYIIKEKQKRLLFKSAERFSGFVYVS